MAWLADGTTRDSVNHTWDDVRRAGGVLAVRWWGRNGKGINWGDGQYGHPDTLANAGWVSDEEFALVMREVNATEAPPSRR